MPAWKGEVDEAEQEGITVDNGWGPKEIVGENGVVTGLKVRRCLTVFDENGRFNPAFSDEEKIIPCDSVILAIGQQADLSFLSGEEGVQVTPRGILKIDENLMTTAPGVFAGGDVAFGPRVLVEAVANGHRAARSGRRSPGCAPHAGRRRTWHRAVGGPNMAAANSPPRAGTNRHPKSAERRQLAVRHGGPPKANRQQAAQTICQSNGHPSAAPC